MCIRLVQIGLALSGVLIGEQASAENTSGEVAQLREALAAQQKQLQFQQEQIEELRAMIGKRPEYQVRTSTAKASPSRLTISNPVATTLPGATTVSWTTNIPASSLIEYGPNADDTRNAAADNLATHHSLTLPDLQPGVKYLIRISSVGEGGESATHSFGTEGNPAAASPQQGVPAKPDAPVEIPPVNPTQEIAGQEPTGAGIEIGPAQLRLGGYLGLTGLYRSTNSGGGPGTSFDSIPFASRAAGNVSESRLTAQATRLSLRVDAAFPERISRFRKLAGYFEMDFNGTTPGTVAVTSTSVGFRLRHAFAEAQYGESWSLAVGQAFTLMTPAKDQLSMWPSDYEMSQAVDTNYLAGMVWNRTPQFRLTYRPSRAFNWAFSVENPEQQLGRGAITFPSCCASDLDTQYNTGSDELGVPNLMPDITTRAAFNGKRIHIDVGGVLRVFRHNLSPYTRDTRQIGGGGNLNLGLKLAKTTKLLVQGSYGSGMGRYIGGLVPDVMVRPDLGISPIITTSWVTGVDQGLTKEVAFSGYYSGVYAKNNFALDTDGKWVGYGFPGSFDSNNRIIHEATGVIAIRVFKTENRGSVQFNNQFSWLSRSPWAPTSSGLRNAASFMFLTQMRYNLP
jgi:hypothetical protein